MVALESQEGQFLAKNNMVITGPDQNLNRKFLYNDNIFAFKTMLTTYYISKVLY